MVRNIERGVEADLIADLTYLRKGAGFTCSRVLQASTFLGVCGGRNQPFEVIRERMVAAIDSLPDRQGSEALMAAYGLTAPYSAHGSLAARRSTYGEKIHRKADTLTDREDAAIAELALRLLTAFFSGAPLPAQLPMPHGGFLVERLEVDTRYEDRLFAEHKKRWRIISLVDGAKGFAYHVSDRASDGRTVLTDTAGCTAQTRYVEGGSLHTLVFPKPLYRGQSHTFSFREVLAHPGSQDADPASDFAGQTSETPTLRYVQRVVFQGAMPPMIWSYDKLSSVERPGEPDEDNRVLLDGLGTGAVEFSQQYGGLCSGIAWRWG